MRTEGPWNLRGATLRVRNANGALLSGIAWKVQTVTKHRDYRQPHRTVVGLATVANGLRSYVTWGELQGQIADGLMVVAPAPTRTRRKLQFTQEIEAALTAALKGDGE